MSETATAGPRQATGKRKLEDTLNRVRALLAKAEAEGATEQEAEALTAKAAELMAAYGIDRARLGALHPETDKPSSIIIRCENPWGAVRAHLLAGLAKALRCQAVLLGYEAGDTAKRVHVFGYESDLERLNLLYTSLLLQMTQALQRMNAPGSPRNPLLRGRQLMAWNRSFLLGFSATVVHRVTLAEESACRQAEQEDKASGGPSTALVLADRSVAVKNALQAEYPVTRSSRLTFTGRGFGAEREAGQRADIGQRRVQNSRQALR